MWLQELRMRWLGRSRTIRQKTGRSTVRLKRSVQLGLERLEERIVPTVLNVGYTPSQIQQAYGINLVQFGSAANPIAGNGAGQTIAVLAPFGIDSNITADLQNFDSTYGTASLNLSTFGSFTGQAVNGRPWFNIVSQTGANAPTGPANALVGQEISLDVEWSHAIAPQANILLVQAGGDIGAAAAFAASQPGVSVVTDSYYNSDLTENSDYTAPVTFLSATGDVGALQVQGVNGTQTVLDTGFPTGGTESPADEPNVIAVGGTTLTTNPDGSYASETGWGFVPPVTTNSSPFLTGSWTTINSGGFNGRYRTARGGSSASATWSLPITSSDIGFNAVEVSATWPAASGGATNATYTISNVTTNTTLATFKVDQSNPSSGVAAGSGSFQDLGSFTVSNGPTRGAAQFLVGDTLQVVLNAGTANGTVVADSVGVGPNGASTGGLSSVQITPSQFAYQIAVSPSATNRAVPDVSFDASSSVVVYDSYQGPNTPPNANPKITLIGTSFSAPAWAGLVATADQGLANSGQPLLTSATALAGLYTLPTFDFHHQTSGYNGFQTSTGYNLVTGLGSPSFPSCFSPLTIPSGPQLDR